MLAVTCDPRPPDAGGRRRRRCGTLPAVSLDVASIRARFSALSRTQDGAPVVYLDGPGGSQTPDSVARAVADYLLNANSNCGGPYVTSEATDRLLEEAHAAAADFLGCTADEVVFGANTTTINFQLAHAVARTLAPGDELIVTELDHDANVSPWLLVAGDRGLTVRTAGSAQITDRTPLPNSSLLGLTAGGPRRVWRGWAY